MAQPLSIQQHTNLPWLQPNPVTSVTQWPIPPPQPSQVPAQTFSSNVKTPGSKSSVDKDIKKIIAALEGQEAHRVVWADALMQNEPGVSLTCPPMGSWFFKADQALKIPPAARTGFRTLGNGPAAVQTAVPFGAAMSDPGLMMSSSSQAWTTAVPQFASNPGQIMPFAPVAATYVPVTSPGWMPNPYASQPALGMGMPVPPFAMPPFSQPMYPINILQPL
ncbi:hypothetical protein C8Q74DRAFT_1373583 [Fomes fomentarius]|nr:hypothetical protein C8Q74DRAFT_1373583 [Fomes fomentarius]